VPRNSAINSPVNVGFEFIRSPVLQCKGASSRGVVYTFRPPFFVCSRK